MTRRKNQILDLKDLDPNDPALPSELLGTMAIGGKSSPTKEQLDDISLITSKKTDEDRGGKWIARSLLLDARGDVAVVVHTQTADTRDSVLLFSNNRTTNDNAALDSEDVRAQVVLKELDTLYTAQLPLLLPTRASRSFTASNLIGSYSSHWIPTR